MRAAVALRHVNFSFPLVLRLLVGMVWVGRKQLSVHGK